MLQKGLFGRAGILGSCARMFDVCCCYCTNAASVHATMSVTMPLQVRRCSGCLLTMSMAASLSLELGSLPGDHQEQRIMLCLTRYCCQILPWSPPLSQYLLPSIWLIVTAVGDVISSAFVASTVDLLLLLYLLIVIVCLYALCSVLCRTSGAQTLQHLYSM